MFSWEIFFKSLYEPLKERWVEVVLTHLGSLFYSNQVKRYNTTKATSYPFICSTAKAIFYRLICIMAIIPNNLFIFFIKFEWFLLVVTKGNKSFARGFNLSNDVFAAWILTMHTKITILVTDVYAPIIINPSYTWTV